MPVAELGRIWPKPRSTWACELSGMTASRHAASSIRVICLFIILETLSKSLCK